MNNNDAIKSMEDQVDIIQRLCRSLKRDLKHLKRDIVNIDRNEKRKKTINDKKIKVVTLDVKA